MTSILALWTLTGYFIDVWAHGQANLVESFLAPWHAVFYSGFLATAARALWPISQLIRYQSRTLAGIPAEYRAGAVGVLMSAFGGTTDALWHLVWGSERGVHVLMSPAHLLLLNGLILIAVSPFISAWAQRRPGDETPALRVFLPELYLKNLRKLSLSRVVDKGLRTIVTHASTELGILPSRFDRVPSDVLLDCYYSVWRTLHGRINASNPNIKLRKGGVYTFYDFVSKRINKDSPMRVLDIGAADCYLAFHLSEEMHRYSHFDCIDVRVRPHMYLNRNITFQQKDILSIISEEPEPSYDYVIISGTLGLFNKDQRHALLGYLEHCTYFFMREVPRFTSLVDVYVEKDRSKYVPWDNFTETGMKADLLEHGISIVEIEHEYDIYVFGKSQAGH